MNQTIQPIGAHSADRCFHGGGREINGWHANGRLSVGVIVDLFRRAFAGGHVKCWERLAEAAAGEELDLTVYFLGQKRGVIPLAENVRYVTLEPMLSTDVFRFLDKIPDHTDLAPVHPQVFRHLGKHHVIHTTDAFFALAKTAQYFARWTGRPLVTSIHTDTPSYTRLYSAQILRRICGDGFLHRVLRDRLRCEERLGAWMQRRLEGYLRRCDWAMGSRREDMERLQNKVLRGRFSILRRGIDRDAFHPRKRDRARLRSELGVPAECFILICAGRLDQGKDVMTLARAARILLDRGACIHTIFAGEGSQGDEIQALLGKHVSLLGGVPQEKLARLYASSDVFVLPSQIEVSPNAVLEAKASGLPVIVSARGGSAQFVRQPGPAKQEDGLLVESNDSWVWSEAIESLRRDPSRRIAMGEQARRTIDPRWPSWRQVLCEDLMPVWQMVARERRVWG